MKRRWLALLACTAAVQRTCRGFVTPLMQRRIVLSTNSCIGSSGADVQEAVNGEDIDAKLAEWEEESAESDPGCAMPFAPALSFEKYITMQEKRVIVTIRYSEGLKAFYLTVAKRIKEAHPDVIIEKRIMAAVDEQAGSSGDSSPSFEVLVDGKVVLPRGRSSRNEKYSDSRPSVFVSMYELEIAIAKARRKRRPSTLYGDEKSAKAASRTLQLIRKNGDLQGGDSA